jgi:hypothetical protein
MRSCSSLDNLVEVACSVDNSGVLFSVTVENVCRYSEELCLTAMVQISVTESARKILTSLFGRR